MTKYFLILASLFFSLGSSQVEEKIAIKGKVYSAADNSSLPGVNVLVKGTQIGVVTDINGAYSLEVPISKKILVFSSIGFETREVKIGGRQEIDIYLKTDTQQLSEVVITEKPKKNKRWFDKSESKLRTMDMASSGVGYAYEEDSDWIRNHNTEEYATVHENIFLSPGNNPLSTFSIDVDAASYSNMRRFLNNGQKPPIDAVRIEEMVNYFNYDYKQPKGDAPFSINTEISQAPWNTQHKLVHIGLQGKKIATENLPASNLVFLIDVSGSMSSHNKLPLLKSGYKMLVDQLRPQDRVAIVVYAGAAGKVLPSTPGSQKETILGALDKLQAGGSTAGGAGIKLAYEIAKRNFVEDGNNRIVLATDGDFNIGASSNGEMERLIEEKRKSGIYLTVLGFGMGNYKDSKMEILADKGNGNYAYIDTMKEAKKVLVNEFGGTLFTIAKDVKIQVEFNPEKVQAYRLIGYENRKLNNEDFNDDKKDAGELGSGHTVTALYEIIPAGVESNFIKSVDKLKYQKQKGASSSFGKEIMNLKLRYKKPDEAKSQLIEQALIDNAIALDKTSDNFQWSSAVASFGMLLRDSEFKGNSSREQILQLANNAKGKDENGYRAEFIQLVNSSQVVAKVD